MTVRVAYPTATCLKHHSPEQRPELAPGGCWVVQIICFAYVFVHDGPVHIG
jgi:hypothetical protein